MKKEQPIEPISLTTRIDDVTVRIPATNVIITVMPSYFQKIRSNEAKNWIEARQILRKMCFAQRITTLIYWNHYTSWPNSLCHAD